jgi:hypothetical protein
MLGKTRLVHEKIGTTGNVLLVAYPDVIFSYCFWKGLVQYTADTPVLRAIAQR